MTGPAQIAALQRLVARLRRRVEFIEGSRFWQFRDALFGIRSRLGFGARDRAPAIAPPEYVESMQPLEPYTKWLLENEPRPSDLERMRTVAPFLAERPSFAIIVDDGGSDGTRAAAAAAAQAYPWVRVVRTCDAGAPGEAWTRFNQALATCPEDVVAFCEPSSVLAPHAAFEVALALNADPGVVAVYGDRDFLDAGGGRSAPQFAPDWSPETFLSHPYTGRVVFYRRAAVVAAGGFREGFDDALHYDLALRVFDAPDVRVAHRSSVLVHELRESQEPREAKAANGAVRAVSDALARRGEKGYAVAGPCAGIAVARYDIVRPGRVEVLVPTRDLAPYLERCLASVFERNAECDLRVTVIDNGSVESATANLLAAYAEREPLRFRVVVHPGPFNFSRLINVGARSTEGPYLLLLNNDAEFLEDGGILAMLEQAQRPTIGAVGARLLYPDGRLQHAGVVVGLGGFAGHVYRGANGSTGTDPAIAGTRNYSAVTAAAMMVRRDVFDAVGGFDERFAIEFNDIDFCMRLGRAGFRNVYLSHVLLRHVESASRGIPAGSSGTATRERERALFQEIWKSDSFSDPYYNRNLTREREDATIEA